MILRLQTKNAINRTVTTPYFEKVIKRTKVPLVGLAFKKHLNPEIESQMFYKLPVSSGKRL